MAHHIMSSGRIRLALRAPEGDQQDNPFAPPPEGAPGPPVAAAGTAGAAPGLRLGFGLRFGFRLRLRLG